MDIKNSTCEDIDSIFRLYQHAMDYQISKKTVVVWPHFKRELVTTEIAENRQWKLIINRTIVCVWAIAFSDPQIWEEKDKDSALYIHRIATHPEYRGQQLVSKIVDWAIDYAKAKNIHYVRLDTLGHNQRLIDYYQSAGFDFLGIFNLKNTSKLPAHYQNQPACLFEIDLH